MNFFIKFSFICFTRDSFVSPPPCGCLHSFQSTNKTQVFSNIFLVVQLYPLQLVDVLLYLLHLLLDPLVLLQHGNDVSDHPVPHLVHARLRVVPGWKKFLISFYQVLKYCVLCICSFKNLFCKLSFGQRPRQCLNKSKKIYVTVMENSI